MLVVPAVAGLTLGPASPWEGTLVVVALLAVFCSQHVVVERLRRPKSWAGKRPAIAWLGVYAAVVVAPGTVLLARGHWWLAAFGAAAAGYLALHVARRRSTARGHRDLWFEIVTVGVLTLGAPAGALVAGAPPWKGWLLWAACVVFFAGSVFHVRAFLRRLKLGRIRSEAATKLARESTILHAGILAGLLALWVARPDIAWWLSIAFAPAVLRAFAAVPMLVRPPKRLPSLVGIGLVELACSLAFLGGVIAGG